MRKVLVVDDEFLVRVGIKSFLNWEENGYTIIGEAADGKQALEIMERELPDVVLTDLKMDGMDGFELIQVSRKRFPTVQFVVLSSQRHTAAPTICPPCCPKARAICSGRL